MVQRRGEALFPVDVQVMFEDGSRVREHWDGRERWKLYTWDRSAAAVSAEVDPDNVLLLDIDRTNNSRTLAPRPTQGRTPVDRALVPLAAGPGADLCVLRLSRRAHSGGDGPVLLAPETILGVWLATALAALPAAILMRDAISSQLGSSLTASKVAAGFDYGWWQEFEAQARGVAKTLAPVVIGAAAPVSNWSALVDGRGIPRSLLVPVAFALAVGCS